MYRHLLLIQNIIVYQKARLALAKINIMVSHKNRKILNSYWVLVLIDVYIQFFKA